MIPVSPQSLPREARRPADPCRHCGTFSVSSVISALNESGVSVSSVFD